MRAAVIVVAAVAAIGWSFGRLNVPAFVVASAWSCVLLALRVCVEVVCARRCVCAVCVVLSASAFVRTCDPFGTPPATMLL